VINLDKKQSYPKAVREIQTHRRTGPTLPLPAVRFFNNVVEQEPSSGE
jgi:hypothetical protein